MSNTLNKHVAAYEGGNLYDFDNEILLTWYSQRVLKHATGARSLLEFGLGHGHTTEIFTTYQMTSRQLERSVIDVGWAMEGNYPELSCGLPAEVFAR
ncbi:hypothetical protein G3435_03945 [Pseudomonas sp. MAFF212428]|uniref:Uncharacterized protein n=1 Tax=Pseudomonas brassicae TaxID=2708063 RepID=A0A6B3NR11_9PSED|nr:hypothetical protein [Pseudomonas brassicae]NER59356.1 hypothetical protein [Pseudomonas brassicae]NER65802.1 hypothetical protein [Pseudomonas brassicae]